jgi:ABC-type polysaccharide/polyol phosphate export permease
MKTQLGCLPIVLVIAQAVLIGMNLSRPEPASWFWVLTPTWLPLGTLLAVLIGLFIHDLITNPLNRKGR